MAIIKCKMCGGDIELSADRTYGTCDSCGSTMTFPKVDDEHRANLFNRANHFRRQNEFDKAVSAYERILNEDNTDAEAHWGVVLSRFGIEYVEDPVSHERIPTCHRVQVASILTDEDYLAALQHAPDSYSRDLYEAEARRIADIQKGILAISAQEKPYDVFICYKESTDGGSRTKDSTLAQDIYYQLKQEGYNVFFARITLEDKLGQQYEPYIFAALNSAKVMLVVGTKPEYFNAVWVKNEWSRYLSLMKQDRSRLLIPCYRDMDAYDLPDELSMLQSQDMSKIGFMQDLIRGVKKVLSASKTQQAEPTVANSHVSMASPLLRRAFMFLEDGDWASADEYCEKVLDMEPENAEAYLGKLMAELCVNKRELLADCTEPFDHKPNYVKAQRFGDSKLHKELQGYTDHIKERNEQERQESIYNQACDMMKRAGTEEQYKYIASLFDQIAGYKDAEDKAIECREVAETVRKDNILNAAVNKMSQNLIDAYVSAIPLLEKISGWKDADELFLVCQQKIEKLNAKAEAERLARERAAEREVRKRKRRNIIFAVLAIIVVAAFFVVTKVVFPNQKYEEQRKPLVGSYITFGSYEQGNTSNGKEDIEWLVLAKENNRLLVISRYALDTKPYNENHTDVTWENCTLRKWLNNDFLHAAFSSTEQAMIPIVTVSADENPDYSTKPGNTTQDKVFLLSIPEVNKYFTSDHARQCEPTAFARTYINNSGFCHWWVRSPGCYQYYAAEVRADGRVNEYGQLNNFLSAVRPALWINLEP